MKKPMGQSVSELLRKAFRSPDFSRLLIFAVMFIATAILQRNFFTASSWVRNLNSFAPLILMTMGQAIIIISGGLDLSVGNALSLYTVLLTTFMVEGDPITGAFAIVLTFIAAMVIGVINGIGMGYFRIPAVIATYATSFIWLGISLFIRPTPGGDTVAWFQAFYRIRFIEGAPEVLGMIERVIPPSLVLILIGVALWYVVSRTRTGRYIYAVGSDEESAYQSGISTAGVKIRASMLNHVFVFLAALYFVGQNQTGDARMGDPLTLRAVASALVGGIALMGGRGSVYFAIIGALIFSFVSKLIFFANIPNAYQTLFGGLIIILAIAASQFVALHNRASKEETTLS